MTRVADAYRGRRVLVTGHTGFKGSWLALWLTEIGAEVIGLALAPSTTPNHWDLLELHIDEHRIDVRDAAGVARVIRQVHPECVFHLAAQALVRRSYVAPVETWSTNVMGTVNVLEACRSVAAVRAIVVATTDKCYENDQRKSPYSETDRLGGNDPYSASKAAAELVASSYRAAFMSDPQLPLLATARAGNVIGGGDWAEDRLIPDLVRAQANGTSLEVRSPGASRPWQHVLDCLAGYLGLGASLLSGRTEFAQAWNFGPDITDAGTVADLLVRMQAQWPGTRWHVGDVAGPHEAAALSLDSSRARSLLGWQPTWPIEKAIAATAAWYQHFATRQMVSSREQIAEFSLAARCNNGPRRANA